MRNRLFILLCLAILVWSPGLARTYIVSVGINDYSRFPEKIPNLILPVNDATDVSNLFSLNSTDKCLLTNANATRNKVLTAMRKEYSMAGKDDTVIFFFSGHGYPGGFCLYDGFLTYADIRKLLSNVKAKKKIIMADACNSGAIRIDAGQSAGVTNSAKKSDVMMFLASRTNEYSIENRKMRNGYFTYYLLRGLKGGADANRDKVVTAKELYNYVSTTVARSTRDKQHPVMWGNFPENMPVVRFK